MAKTALSMRSTTSFYYVEVKEGDAIKRVPHTDKKHCEFMSRQTAVEFLNDLVGGNPGFSFRLCKRTETETAEKWLTGNK